MTSEWSGLGLGQDKKHEWEHRQHGDWMRRNKSMKMIIDTFERYYQRAQKPTIHTHTQKHTHTHMRFSLNIKAIV